MIPGMSRSVFVILIVLALLIMATFTVVALSTLRSLQSEAVPATDEILTGEPRPSLTETHTVAGSDATDAVGATPITLETETPNGIPTETQIAVSDTPASTATITLTATIASTPTAAPTRTITPTADIDICSQIQVEFIKATSTIGLWRLRNNNPFPVYLNRIDLIWPKDNDAIFNAVLDDVVIWAGEDLVSPTLMSSWLGNPIRQEVSGTVPLEFGFGTDAASSGYNLTVYFDNGCTITASD